jgi:predicted nucleotidyltransferase
VNRGFFSGIAKSTLTLIFYSRPFSVRKRGARDAHALSDIDLLIVADFQGPRRDRVEQILNIAQGLKQNFPVEPHPLRPEEFRSVRKRPFFRHIAREALEV